MFDGNSTEGSLLGRVCSANDYVPVFESSSNTLTVQIVTDSARIPRSVFIFYYFFSPGTCKSACRHPVCTRPARAAATPLLPGSLGPRVRLFLQRQAFIEAVALYCKCPWESPGELGDRIPGPHREIRVRYLGWSPWIRLSNQLPDEADGWGWAPGYRVPCTVLETSADPAGSACLITALGAFEMPLLGPLLPLVWSVRSALGLQGLHIQQVPQVILTGIGEQTKRNTDLICQAVRCYVVLHSLHLDSIAAQSRMPRNSASEFMGRALFWFASQGPGLSTSFFFLNHRFLGANKSPEWSRQGFPKLDPGHLPSLRFSHCLTGVLCFSQAQPFYFPHKRAFSVVSSHFACPAACLLPGQGGTKGGLARLHLSWALERAAQGEAGISGGGGVCAGTKSLGSGLGREDRLGGQVPW